MNKLHNFAAYQIFHNIVLKSILSRDFCAVPCFIVDCFAAVLFMVEWLFSPNLGFQ